MESAAFAQKHESGLQPRVMFQHFWRRASTIKRWRSSKFTADLSGLVQLPCFTAKEANYSVLFFVHRWCIVFCWTSPRQVKVSAFKIISMQRASGQSRPVATEPHLAHFEYIQWIIINSVQLGHISRPCDDISMHCANYAAITFSLLLWAFSSIFHKYSFNYYYSDPKQMTPSVMVFMV
jgi:hypothetical protein